MADNFRFAQLQDFSLAGAGAILGATSITLKSMKDIDGNALTMAGTFGAIGFGTLEPGSGTNEEQISFSGLTNNSNGTVTLTGVCSIGFTYPYTSTSGLAKTHAGSTTFIISNTSGFYDKFTSKIDDETISGLYTFTTSPVVPTPTTDYQAVTKKYADTVATGKATYVSNIISGTAGETVVAGAVVYFKTSDQKWYNTLAGTTTTFRDVRIGICQNGANANGAITICISGEDTTQTGLTPGARYYLSNSSGALVATTDQTNVVFVGWAIDATTLLLAYRFDTAGSPYVFTAQYASLKNTTTTTLDWNKSNVQYIQLANGSQTFTFANPVDGGRYILILRQPASSSAGTVVFPGTVLWSGGSAPTLTTTNSKTDIISLIYDATNTCYYASTSYNF